MSEMRQGIFLMGYDPKQDLPFLPEDEQPESPLMGGRNQNRTVALS